MVKQQRRTNRCFLAAAGSSVAKVRFPVCPVRRRPPPTQQGSEAGISDSSSTTAEEERRVERRVAGSDDGRSQPGGPGLEGSSGELDLKRAKMDGADEIAALTNRDSVPGSCASVGDVPPPDQQGAAEHSEGSRAAELQGAGSLKVTIQQSSESREFGQTDRTAERQMGGLHCHVCNLTCRSLQLFQEHMSASEHLKKLQEITHSVHLNTRPLQDSRGRRLDSRRWCDTCQAHFSGDVIVHRRTKQHKMCKQLCRPFCPVCRRHFRTPRKFVEHMKSPEHKQQVQIEEAQEEELITVDAVGCFEEEEEEEQDAEEEEVEVADEEDDNGGGDELTEFQTAEEEEVHREEYDPNTTYGSSFVVPVHGFVCRLCKKFFYNETTARHTHCRTHAHYLHLQSGGTQRRRKTRRRGGQRDEDEDRSAH